MAHNARFDRLSAHPSPSATPPPQGRSNSPGPRKWTQHGSPSLLARPSLNPRSSSLSLASNASTTSLPGTARVVNGSSLRNQVNLAPPDDGGEAVTVLEQIVGKRVMRRGSTKVNGNRESLQEIFHGAAEIDFGDMSLQAFVDSDNALESLSLAVDTPITYSIEQYDEDREKFEDLHRSILACDEVLKSVEQSLASFQADLGAVSAEIESLQARSMALNTKLETRKVVENRLRPAVEDLFLSPAVVKKISEEPIDDAWFTALEELDKRSAALLSKDGKHTKAIEDLRPLLENLEKKAVERIRDYLVGQIKAIRSPGVNAQFIQRQAFVRSKSLYAFLTRHESQVSEGILQAYVNTMRWYYLHNFSRYEAALRKLRINIVDKQDRLGSEEPRRGSMLGNARNASSSYDPFSLGRRNDMLKHPSHTPPSAYIAEDDKSSHFLEVPFRAFNMVLVDNACWEYSVLSSFIGSAHRQPQALISRTFTQIFEPTFGIGQTLTKSLIDSNFDALGVLLCVRLTQYFAFSLQRRRVPVVDGYINSTSMILWPRLQQLIDHHCESVRQVTSQLPSRPAASSLLGSGPSSAGQSAAPHPLTQRFAQFAASVATLSAEAGDDEPLARSLGRLRADFGACLLKLSRGIGDSRRRERFLDNNYALVITVLDGIEGKLAEEMRNHFKENRSASAD